MKPGPIRANEEQIGAFLLRPHTVHVLTPDHTREGQPASVGRPRWAHERYHAGARPRATDEHLPMLPAGVRHDDVADRRIAGADAHHGDDRFRGAPPRPPR